MNEAVTARAKPALGFLKGVFSVYLGRSRFANGTANEGVSLK